MMPRTPELAKTALEFGKKHFRSFNQITNGRWGMDELWFTLGDLSYDHNPKHLGFNFSLAMGNHELFVALTVWLAIRIGRKRNGLPYVIYDGTEKWTIDPAKFDGDGWWTREVIKTKNAYHKWELRWYGKWIKPELKRLSALWHEQVGNNTKGAKKE
jgi:hypothetical protein